MLKTLAFATVSCMVFNKLAYHLLLKAPGKLKTEVLGRGQYFTLSYNPISQQWVNGLRSDSFCTEPNSSVHHVQDFFVSNHLYPACFRLRSCHLAMSKELSQFKLLPLDLLSLSEILMSYADCSQSVVRANLWEEADNYTLAFGQVEIHRPDHVDLEVVKAQDFKGINTSDKYLKEFQGDILQGHKFSVFFTKGDKVYTPEATHPLVSPFTVKETVIRDTIIVTKIQKITGCSEETIRDLNEFDAAILASDSFILSPIKTIQWSKEKFEFNVDKGKTLAEKIEKHLTEKQFYCLAQDGFTNEAWLEDLRTVQKLVN